MRAALFFAWSPPFAAAAAIPAVTGVAAIVGFHSEHLQASLLLLASMLLLAFPLLAASISVPTVGGIHFVPLCPHFFTFLPAGVPAAATTRHFYILFQGLFVNYICVKNEVKNKRSPHVSPKESFLKTYF